MIIAFMHGPVVCIFAILNQIDLIVVEPVIYGLVGLFSFPYWLGLGAKFNECFIII